MVTMQQENSVMPLIYSLWHDQGEMYSSNKEVDIQLRV